MVDTGEKVDNTTRKGVPMNQNKRRAFSREFKLEAVKLIIEQGYSVAQAADSLGISATVLRTWKKKLQAEGEQAFPGKGRLNQTDEQLHKLRQENKRLRMERDILKKATAFFAKEPS